MTLIRFREGTSFSEGKILQDKICFVMTSQLLDNKLASLHWQSPFLIHIVRLLQACRVSPSLSGFSTFFCGLVVNNFAL